MCSCREVRCLLAHGNGGTHFYGAVPNSQLGCSWGVYSKVWCTVVSCTLECAPWITRAEHYVQTNEWSAQCYTQLSGRKTRGGELLKKVHNVQTKKRVATVRCMSSLRCWACGMCYITWSTPELQAQQSWKEASLVPQGKRGHWGEV